MNNVQLVLIYLIWVILGCDNLVFHIFGLVLIVKGLSK